MLMLIVIFISVISGKNLRFPETETPDFYAIEMNGESSYTLFKRQTIGRYSSEDGRFLYQWEGSWRICTIDHNGCREMFFQNSDRDPTGGYHWIDITRNDARVHIEIKALRCSRKERGIGIKTSDGIFFVESFNECKNYGIQNSLSFVSYNRTEVACYYTEERDIKLVKDDHSTLFISLDCRESIDNDKMSEPGHYDNDDDVGMAATTPLVESTLNSDDTTTFENTLNTNTTTVQSNLNYNATTVENTLNTYTTAVESTLDTKIIIQTSTENTQDEQQINKDELETKKDNEKLEDDDVNIILYICIGLAVLLGVLIIVVMRFICKFKSFKTSSLVTENEYYGRFSQEYYQEDTKKTSTVTDANDYYGTEKIQD